MVYTFLVGLIQPGGVDAMEGPVRRGSLWLAIEARYEKKAKLLR
jgi:hypothetical protein